MYIYAHLRITRSDWEKRVKLCVIQLCYATCPKCLHQNRVITFLINGFFLITRSFKTLRLQKLGFFQILRNLWLSKWWIVQVNPPGYEWTANESAIKSASVSSIICKCNVWTSRYPSNLQDNQLFFNILPCSFSFLLLPSLHETLHEPRWEYIDLLPG